MEDFQFDNSFQVDPDGLLHFWTPKRFRWLVCERERICALVEIWFNTLRSSGILNKFQSQNWIAKSQTFASFETQTVGNFWGLEHHGQGIGLFTCRCNHDDHQHRKSFNTRTESDKSPTLFVFIFSQGTATVGPIINEVLFVGPWHFSFFGDVYFGWWKRTNFSCVHLREQVSFQCCFMPQVCQFRFGHCVPDSEFWPAQWWTCLKPTDITVGDMLICSTAFSDARGWHSAQHLRKSVLFRRGMDLDLVQGHPKQTWIIEYVESPNQTAAFCCVWNPIYMLQMVTENWPRRVEEPTKFVILTFWKTVILLAACRGREYVPSCYLWFVVHPNSTGNCKNKHDLPSKTTTCLMYLNAIAKTPWYRC